MTKLKLEKEFGGGVLQYFLRIAGLSWTGCCKPLCMDSKLRNAFQDAKNLVRKVTRMIFRQVIRVVSRQMIRKVFRQVIRLVFLLFVGWTIPLAKVVDFDPLGALSGPGAPDPDVARFQIKVKHGILNISLYVCNNMNFGTNANLSVSHGKSTRPSKLQWL